MNIEIDYQKVKALYPEAIAELMNQLRNSKSIQKNKNETDLVYSMNWWMKIDKSRETFFEEYGHHYEIINELNVRTFLSDIIGWGIEGKVGRWRGYAKCDVVREIPTEITHLYMAKYKKELDEKIRISKLTPEERNQEIEKCLSELRGTP